MASFVVVVVVSEEDDGQEGGQEAKTTYTLMIKHSARRKTTMMLSAARAMCELEQPVKIFNGTLDKGGLYFRLGHLADSRSVILVLPEEISQGHTLHHILNCHASHLYLCFCSLRHPKCDLHTIWPSLTTSQAPKNIISQTAISFFL